MMEKGMGKGPGKGHGRPPLVKEITAKPIGDDIYCIVSPPVSFHQYLVLGQEKALLVDTGMGIGSIRKVVESITSLPIVVVNTHCHPDHAGGNAEFDPALCNPADLDVFRAMATKEFRIGDVSHMPGDVDWAAQLQPTGPEPVPAEDGQIIDLGGRQLKIIFTPGHTHGSLCVFEEATGILFTGDNVQGRTTTVREWNSSSVEELYESLLKLARLPVRRMFGGHIPNENAPEVLAKEIKCAEEILAGSKDEAHEFRGLTVYEHQYEGIGIEYAEGNIRKQ